jgi:hypothetical protein
MDQKKLPLLGLACIVFATGTAWGQEEGWTDAEAPAPAEQKPAPESEAEPTPTPKPASEGSTCVTTNNGLDQASAYTGWQLVCDEIRNQGVTLAPPGANTASAYHVTFDRLGARLVVRVAYEAPVGHAVRTRKVVLDGPEELTVAAPRIARAVVKDLPLEESERVDNLVGEETRVYRKKSGEFLWGLGVLGTMVPTASAAVSPGLEFMGYYETPTYGVGFSLRTTFGNDDNGVDQQSIAVGGRYFFGEGDVSPFIGAGVGASWLSIDEAKSEYHAEGSGFGAFGEVGVELLRLHSSRMIIGLRMDAPFYEVERGYYWDYDTGSATTGPEKSYELPLTLSASYAW